MKKLSDIELTELLWILRHCDYWGYDHETDELLTNVAYELHEEALGSSYEGDPVTPGEEM